MRWWCDSANGWGSSVGIVPLAIVEFGRFRVVPHRRELLADGRPIKLGGRDFDVLVALIEASGTVVSKDELMSRVWTGGIVEENSLQGTISVLRKAFDADRDLIRTVARRGYQFTGEIRARSAGVPGATRPAFEAPPSNEPPRAGFRTNRPQGGGRDVRSSASCRRAGSGAARQLVDRGIAVCQSEWRSQAGIFRRRHGRGDHHGAVAGALAVRDRPQFDLHLQGPGYRRQTGRSRTGCPLCA
jgi:DNA-binding winged helix-turn-helix (wHTH) protein